jgi:DNA-binding CsgD family transcriptional regulator
VAELRAQAGHWDAGPWLLSQIDHRGAALAFDDGDPARADELAHRALSDAWLGPWPPLVVTALEILACVAAARESTTEAARLLGAAARARNDTGFRLDAEPERTRTASTAATVRQELGNDDFDRAFDEGTRLGLDEAVAYARRARGERKRPSHGWDGLTPTERQVAELAIAGLTNAQIAERLFVGAQTVKTHLSNVYAKVGVANRTQLVGDAARRGITS